jgi:hypothetical protein
MVMESRSQEVLARQQRAARAKARASASVPVTQQSLETRIRNRLVNACIELMVDPVYVVRQFNSWRYGKADMQEIDGWEQPVFEQHVRLLAEEIRPVRDQEQAVRRCRDCAGFTPGQHSDQGIGECGVRVKGQPAWQMSKPVEGPTEPMPAYPGAPRHCMAFKDR